MSNEADALRNAILRVLMASARVRNLSDATLEALAVQIGTTEELLKEAKRRFGKRRRGNTGNKVNEKEHPQLEVDMPKEVHEQWLFWCERNCVEPNATIRGLLHQYLLSRWEPVWLNGSWRFRGKILKYDPVAWERKNKGAWPHRERPLVTKGARDALHHRAHRLGIPRSWIIRGLILEVLEGRLKEVLPVAARTMYSSAESYLGHLDGPEAGGDEVQRVRKGARSVAK